jgi:tetratricopeptide (TPR) repeat protein
MVRKPAAAVLMLLSVVVPPAVAAQSPAACEGRRCTSTELWAGVSNLHRLKIEFVDALRDFAEAVTGSYGDEGSRLSPALEAAQRALEAWDRAIVEYEAKARASAASADARIALGSVYLDRARMRDALTEFAVAERMDSRRPDVYGLAAMAYELTGDSESAAMQLEKAATFTPQDPATLYRLAKALADNDSQQAITAQRQVDAAYLKPSETGNAPVQLDRVGLLRQVGGVAPIFPPARYVAAFRLFDGGRYPEGIAALRAASAADPLVAGPPGGAAAAAGGRLRRGQLQAALSELRNALTQGSSAETQRVAGVAYWADEQYAKSIEAFTAAVRMDARDERARIALADVFVAAGKPEEAEQVLKDAIALAPESGQAHFRLSRLYQSKSLVSNAVAELEQAASCSPLVGLDYLYETLGGLYATQADFDHAVTAYRKRTDVNPNNSEAHRKLGEIYVLQGRDNAALVEFAVAVWLDRKNAEAFGEAGQAYLRASRFADAVRMSQQALALDSTQQKARFTLGTALLRLGRSTEGQRELELFQREVDDTANARRHALEASTLERDAARAEDAGDYMKAAGLLQGALELTPGDTGLELDIGRMLVKAGQPADALEHLANASRSDDRADIHQLRAEAYAALGETDARDREETRFRQLVEQRKEERLKTRPLLR